MKKNHNKIISLTLALILMVTQVPSISVFAETELYSGGGKMTVYPDEEKKIAQKALMQSGIWDKTSGLPEGGDTVITKEFEKDGIGLSGGENQKVSVARLFAKDFQFAVLDEPSSALDPIAEYKMYENLIEVTKDKTVMYISHRLSSAVLSDKIIVIGKGKVLESGSHSELMNNDGEYSRMFRLQASSYNKQEEVAENE